MPIRIEHPAPHIVLVTIDNPEKRNAMSRAMMAEMAAMWDNLETSDCRCIVLTGAGDKAFNAGADVSGDLSASCNILFVRKIIYQNEFNKPKIKEDIILKTKKQVKNSKSKSI